MKIIYQKKALKKICKDNKYAARKLGPENAKKLRIRLAEINIAENVDVLAKGRGQPHSLKGDRKGQYAIRLSGGKRLVFKPSDEVVPRKSDGGIDWKAVTAVTICFIGDYHD